MPLQKNGRRPLERPSGMLPPPVDVSGVTELRLHGVGGTTPENLLVDAAPQRVSGDRIAGFYRTADLPGRQEGGTRLRGRHVEAYSWGGLTSRSASRVLWLFLFPFALANVAGWMCTPQLQQTRRRFVLYRWIVRTAATGMTLNLLLLIAMTTMDVVGYQCGAQSACADRWWLRWLHSETLVVRPGLRVLVGALIPLLVIIVLAVLAGRSLNRYEVVPPPRYGERPDVPCTTTPARPRAGLDDKDFWNGGRSVRQLALVHVGAGLAFLGWILCYTAGAVSRQAEGRPDARWLMVAATGLALLSLVLALGALALGTIPSWWAGSVVGAGTLAVIAATAFVVVQPALQAVPADAPPGPLPGMRIAINTTFACCLLPAVAVLPLNYLAGRARKAFFAAGPFVVTTIGFVLLNGVGIGLMIRIADFLGNVPNPGVVQGPRPTPLVVYGAVYAVTPFLTLLPTALLLLFGIWQAIAIWHAGRPSRCSAILEKYGHPPRVGWVQSTVQDEADRPKRTPRKPLSAVWRLLRRPGWAASIARGQRLATTPRDVDKLLTIMAFVALIVLGVFWVSFVVRDDVPRLTPWILSASTWLAAALPIGVVILLRQGWRNLDRRRTIGVLWDVGTFWPRAYHPLAPPSYAERAVPDLQRRLWYLHEHGGATVIAAHSQGSVLAAAALLQRDRRPPCDEVALVTFGSPLSKLYGWAFPAYFGASTLAALRTRVWRWHNFSYDTDFIGGCVSTGPNRETWDTALLDPPTAEYIYGQPPPALGRHSGYWSDPEVWNRVDTDSEEIPVPSVSRHSSHSPAPPTASAPP